MLLLRVCPSIRPRVASRPSAHGFSSNLVVGGGGILLKHVGSFVFCLKSDESIGNLNVGHGPGSSAGIATGYGLDGPGIESRWGRDFPHLSRPAVGTTQPPVQRVPAHSRG